MRKRVVAGTFLLVAASLSAGQSDGRSLLRDAAARYRDANSFRLEWQTKITTSSPYSNGWTKQMYVVAAADHKFHFEVQGTGLTGIRISDGQSDWFYRPALRQYSVQSTDPAKPRPQVPGIAGGTTESWIKSAMQSLLHLDDDADSAELLREEMLAIGTAALRCSVVQVKRAMSFREAVISTRDNTYWIDQSSGLVRKATLITRGPVSPDDDMDDQTRTVEISYTRVELNTAPAPALFVFTPPAEAYLVGDAREATPPVSIGRAAPALKLKDKNGAMFDLADLKGKVAVVQFWASWCPPCLEEMKALVELQKLYAGRDLVVVGVDSDAIAERGAMYFASQRYGWTNLHDVGGIHRRTWRVPCLPFVAVVDRDGKIAWTHVGFGAGFLDSLRSELNKPELALIK